MLRGTFGKGDVVSVTAHLGPDGKPAGLVFQRVAGGTGGPAPTVQDAEVLEAAAADDSAAGVGAGAAATSAPDLASRSG